MELCTFTYGLQRHVREHEKFRNKQILKRILILVLRLLLFDLQNNAYTQTMYWCTQQTAGNPRLGPSGALTALRCLSLGRSRGAAQHGASDVAGKDGQDFTANPIVKGSSCLSSRVSSGRAWR